MAARVVSSVVRAAAHCSSVARAAVTSVNRLSVAATDSAMAAYAAARPNCKRGCGAGFLDAVDAVRYEAKRREAQADERTPLAENAHSWVSVDGLKSVVAMMELANLDSIRIDGMLQFLASVKIKKEPSNEGV